MGIESTALSNITADEVTLTKSSGGQISAKTGNGANQIPILTAAGKYPAIDGSLITGLTQDIGEGHITILAWAYSSIDAGSFVFVPETTSVLGQFRSSDGAQNYALSWKVYLAAGTYTLSTQQRTGAANGIITAKIDGSSIGTMDLYSAGEVQNVTKSITGIAIATSGLKTLQFVMASKNASSSAYYCHLQSITLFRTA